MLIKTIDIANLNALLTNTNWRYNRESLFTINPLLGGFIYFYVPQKFGIAMGTLYRALNYFARLAAVFLFYTLKKILHTFDGQLAIFVGLNNTVRHLFGG